MTRCANSAKAERESSIVRIFRHASRKPNVTNSPASSVQGTCRVPAHRGVSPSAAHHKLKSMLESVGNAHKEDRTAAHVS